MFADVFTAIYNLFNTENTQLHAYTFGLIKMHQQPHSSLKIFLIQKRTKERSSKVHNETHLYINGIL